VLTDSYTASSLSCHLSRHCCRDTAGRPPNCHDASLLDLATPGGHSGGQCGCLRLSADSGKSRRDQGYDLGDSILASNHSDQFHLVV
jgi:hypothetical protein